jgi:DMSO/TMAO reductase YedYZ molybdopterin-dependent catalytic subunit
VFRKIASSEFIVLLIMALVACAPRPAATMAPTSAATSASLATVTPSSVPTNIPPTSVATSASPEAESALSPCVLEPVVAPTPSAEKMGYAQLDPDTGLHITGQAQHIDLASYRLEVSGKVDRPLNLSYDDLRCLPKVEARVVLECPGLFVDEAAWAGAPLREVLALAGVQEGALKLKLISADGYVNTLTISEELLETAFLAYEWEGEPLPILHGFPVRVVLPGVSGGSWVKWLVAIQVN